MLVEGFDAIEISASDMQGLSTPTEQPETVAVKEELSETETSETPEVPETPEVKKFKLGDVEYEEAKLLEAIKDSENKSKWLKSNTEEAQRIAALKKEHEQEVESTRKLRTAIEPMIEFINELKEDSDYLPEIREQFVERYGVKMGKIFDALTAFDPETAPNPYASDLERAKKELEDFKAERQAQDEAQKFIADEIKTLRDTHKELDADKAQAIADFATTRFTETGEVLTLEAAYKLMNYDALKEKADKKDTPAIPHIPKPGAGATKIESKKPDKFEDIDIGEFHLVT